MDTISQFFNINQFIPHGHCFLWMPSLLWTLVASDGIIALSYYSIPLALVMAVGKRTNDRIKWIIMMFSAFIFACGTTHLIAIATIWYPNYWLDAGVKALTAAISAVTAIALWPIVREARAYVDFQEERTAELFDSNTQLKESLDSLKQEQRELQYVSELSGLLHVCNNFDEISKAVTDALARIFPESAGGLYLLDESESEFSMMSSWGAGNLTSIINSESCWSFRLGRIFPDSTMESGIQCDACKCSLSTEQFCLPVQGVGKTLALLQLQGVRYYSDEYARSILSVIIERLGLAIYNLRLKKSLEFKSTRDGLTGLFNRRYLDEALEVEVKRSNRAGTVFSIIMFDLDDFKLLNDSYGHEAGDQALKIFADLISSKHRGGDLACRYGGEEFVVILPGSDLENAQHKADSIRQELMEVIANNESFPFRQLTVSAGVSCYKGIEDKVPDLLHQADLALLEAKRQGKNTVKTFREVLAEN